MPTSHSLPSGTAIACCIVLCRTRTSLSMLATKPAVALPELKFTRRVRAHINWTIGCVLSSSARVAGHDLSSSNRLWLESCRDSTLIDMAAKIAAHWSVSSTVFWLHSSSDRSFGYTVLDPAPVFKFRQSSTSVRRFHQSKYGQIVQMGGDANEEVKPRRFFTPTRFLLAWIFHEWGPRGGDFSDVSLLIIGVKIPARLPRGRKPAARPETKRAQASSCRCSFRRQGAASSCTSAGKDAPPCAARPRPQSP